MSVNDRVLFAQDQQDLILHHSFNQLIPKPSTIKFLTLMRYLNLEEVDSRIMMIRINIRTRSKMIKSSLLMIARLTKNGEFILVRTSHKYFTSTRKNVLETRMANCYVGRSLFVVFVILSCTRIHKLTPDDEKAFDKFVIACREASEGNGKPDF